MNGMRNIRGGLALMGVGLVGGLAMSLYAFQPIVKPPESLDRYDDLPRRLLRLAHIAAIMLPLINVVVGAVAERIRLRDWASWTLLLSAAGLPLALAAEAMIPGIRWMHLPGIPATAFTVAIGAAALGAGRGLPERRHERPRRGGRPISAGFGDPHATLP